jgi:hypothetical protein
MAAVVANFFLLLGSLGFIYGVTNPGMHLFGIFHVNALHNLIHLGTGAVFLWTAKRSECASLRAFQGFTLVYGVLTLLGNLYPNSLMIGPMAMNQAGTLMHALLMGFFFYCGFLSEYKRTVQCRA